MEAEERRKMGKAWEHLSLDIDASGRGGGGGGGGGGEAVPNYKFVGN